MLFDLHTSAGVFSAPWLKSSVLPRADRGYANVASGFWGEHCIECSAPACYDTCEKYESAPSSLCRRFVGGIRKAKLSGRKIGYAVHFKPWGKLELEYNGRTVSRHTAKLLEVFNRICCGPIPHMGRNAVNHYKSLVDKFVGRYLSRTGNVRQWVVECVANENTELIAAIFTRGKGEVFVRRLAIVPGCNRWMFNVPQVNDTCYFRLSSLEGSKFPIVFTELEVSDGQSASSGSATIRSKVEAKGHAEFVKCVIWDLDNTLWRGILVEDGVEGIELKNEVVSAIKELDHRGIVSSICSKNDFEPAMACLKTFCVSDYFVFPKINWNRKSENIKAIAKAMNIGLDALAFVDDAAHERGEVADALPMIRVYDEKSVERMLGEHCFNPPMSSESAGRRLSYIAEMSRQDAEAGLRGDHKAFIRSCEIKIEISRIGDEVTCRRCWELVNRTNQLTLAARRYTEDQFCALTAEGGTNSYAVRCHDKYGDYGIVGFVALRGSEVVEFVMSCRVAKKYCEQSVILAFAKKAKSSGMSRLTAFVCPTGRNSALIDAFKAMPFVEITTENQNLKISIDLTRNFSDVFSNSVTLN